MIFPGAFLCAIANLFGTNAPPPQPPVEEPVPYDGDLFRKDKKAVFATGEYLLWKVSEGAVDYSVEMNKPAHSPGDTFAIGNYHNAKFDWASGLRVGLGWFNAPHYWDVGFQYTFLPADGNNSAHRPHKKHEFLNGTWAQPDLAPLTKANSHIALRYHLLDVFFSRRFHTNNHLRVNVFGGVASAFIYHKWKILYEDLAHHHSRLKTNWHFEGTGLRLGLKLDWFLGGDFYLTGLASSAILSGWYVNKIRQTTSGSGLIRDTEFHDIRLAYNAQFMTGPSWQKAFDKIRVEVMAGYELAIWSNLHEVFRSSHGPATATKETFINNSNLSLQGLVIRTNIDF